MRINGENDEMTTPYRQLEANTVSAKSDSFHIINYADFKAILMSVSLYVILHVIKN